MAITENKACSCGSGKKYDTCCGPLIEGRQIAATAEELMRSRYSAFVMQNPLYLLATWAPESRPAELSLDGNTTKWLGLTILETERGSIDDADGTVTFQARFLEGLSLCILEEKSLFIKQSGIWLYRDGETNIISRKLSKNGPCPCGSGRKLKRCCLNG